MAKASPTLDVFLRAADTIYRAVPLQVVLGWAEQGRLAPTDGVRKGDTEGAWIQASAHPIVTDYFPRKAQNPTPQPPPRSGEGEKYSDSSNPLRFGEGGSRSEAGGVHQSKTAANRKSELPIGMPASVVNEPIELEEADHAWKKLHADDDDEVDMIPLIDISLVLLIFFMMTSAIAAVSPIDVPGMKNAMELSQSPEALTVVIDKRPGGAIYYAVHVDEKPAEKADNDLNTLSELLTRVDMQLVKAMRPPEVRLACHKELPFSYIRDLSAELSKRQQQKKIASFAAEVNENKK
jgi:biopolymer transport protein ExbD